MSWGRYYFRNEEDILVLLIWRKGPKTLTIEILKVTDQDGNFVRDASILSK